jgi:hypothetical protein
MNQNVYYEDRLQDCGRTNRKGLHYEGTSPSRILVGGAKSRKIVSRLNTLAHRHGQE